MTEATPDETVARRVLPWDLSGEAILRILYQGIGDAFPDGLREDEDTSVTIEIPDPGNLVGPDPISQQRVRIYYDAPDEPLVDARISLRAVRALTALLGLTWSEIQETAKRNDKITVTTRLYPYSALWAAIQEMEDLGKPKEEGYP